jgi:hypothetical protein
MCDWPKKKIWRERERERERERRGEIARASETKNQLMSGWGMCCWVSVPVLLYTLTNIQIEFLQVKP